MLPGIPIAGKTGTTNAYRDAWFVGYTGNYIGGVWFGNDDYQSTNRMTGGSLPAMTWQQIMVYAHQGIELRPLPGLNQTPARPGPAGGRRRPPRPGRSDRPAIRADPPRRRDPGPRSSGPWTTSPARSPPAIRRRAAPTRTPPAPPQGAVASASDRRRPAVRGDCAAAECGGN